MPDDKIFLNSNKMWLPFGAVVTIVGLIVYGTVYVKDTANTVETLVKDCSESKNRITALEVRGNTVDLVLTKIETKLDLLLEKNGIKQR